MEFTAIQIDTKLTTQFYSEVIVIQDGKQCLRWFILQNDIITKKVENEFDAKFKLT